jgi:hypothetical protein
MPCDSDDGKSSKSKGRLHAVNIAGRIAALGLAVASAALMATASQCTIVLYNGGPAHTVTYSNFGPFVYVQQSIRFSPYRDDVVVIYACS